MSTESLFQTSSIPFVFISNSSRKSRAIVLQTRAVDLYGTHQIGERSRAAAGVSMDGRGSHILNPGDSVTVQSSPFPVPCINRSSIVEDNEDERQGEGARPGKEDDWVRDINNLLQYNATFRSKALLRHSRT